MNPAELTGVAGLEQRCFRPGRWRIEGWSVVRGRGGWTLTRWPDDPVVVVTTLREAREWIVDYNAQPAGEVPQP